MREGSRRHNRYRAVSGDGRGHGHRHGPGPGDGHGVGGVRALETTLADMRAGDRVVIESMGRSELCMQALRLGISEGAEVTVVTKLPAGPVVVRSGLQEIAVGRRLAGRIGVRRSGERSSDGPL